MFELYGIGAVGLIIALVEVAKKVGIPARFSPILALILGIAAGIVTYGATDVVQGIVLGLAAGASAVGVYSGTKNVMEKKGDRDE